MNITLSIFFEMNSIQITEVFFFFFGLILINYIPFKIIKSQSGKGGTGQAGAGGGGVLGRKPRILTEAASASYCGDGQGK